jgi:alpha-L-fucosidase
LGEAHAIETFFYLPPSDGSARGIVDRYRVFTSADNKTWAEAAAGEFANIRANPVEQAVRLAAPEKARYLRFVAGHALDDSPPAIAEIGISAR